MEEEIRLMKGNEAVAHAAVRYGVDGYFGYPITPQSEILETLEELMPWETTGMVVLQAESEIAAINMVYGGAATGKACMTSSSSPRYKPQTGRHLIYRRRGASGSHHQLHARRSRTRHNPAIAG